MILNVVACRLLVTLILNTYIYIMLYPRQASKELSEIPTDVLIQSYADRILVLVTQMGKVGNLVPLFYILVTTLVTHPPKIQASIPDTVPLLPPPPSHPSDPNRLLLPPPPAAIQLTYLLGGSSSEHMQTLHSLYAAQIATIIWTHESQTALEASRRSIVVGVALCGRDSDANADKRERAVFEGVMTMLQELLLST